MRAIFLIGFMGSGKSSVGKELASVLNLNWIDTDTQIELETNKKIPNIFSEEGELAFRHYETMVLKSMPIKHHVISTGGGIVEKINNRKWMRENGMVIYLYSSLDEINKRLTDDITRPLWNANLEKNRGLYKRRLPLYQNTAHYQINTDNKSISNIVKEILSVIKA